MTLPLITVELHDFSPKYKKECNIILEALERIGNTSNRVVHLVPNWGGDHNILDDNHFVDLIHKLSEGGDEIVLHGYTHKRPQEPYHSLHNRLLGEYRHRGEAEFLDIGYTESIQRIRQARNIVQQIGLDPKGFVAPGWKLSGDALRAVIDEEFEYTVSRNSISFLKQENLSNIRILCYEFTAYPRMADHIFRVYNKLIMCTINENKLIRIPLHPQDLANKNTFDYAIDTLIEMQRFQATTYSELSSVHDALKIKENVQPYASAGPIFSATRP